MSRITLPILAALLAATSILASAPAQAKAKPKNNQQIRIILGGASYHFVSSSTRRWLNQNQQTVGIEYQYGAWNFQITHMRDSFYCSAYQLIVSRRWKVFQVKNWLSGGFELGALATHRCTEWRTTKALWVTSRTKLNIRKTYPTVAYWESADCGCGWHEYWVWLHDDNGFAPKKWVFGIIPGAYLNLGNHVRIEASLIYSPWSHRLIFYAQLSFLVRQW